MSQGITAATSAVTDSLLRTGSDNIAVAATLLKKATDSDKDLVNQLLPASAPHAGKLNLTA